MFLKAWNMSSGLVEIHKAGCSHNPDSGKSKFRSQDQVEFGTVDWDTKYDFAHDYWDNGILAENEAENGVGSFDVFQEMDFKPCTKSLPLNQAKETEMPVATPSVKRVVKTSTVPPVKPAAPSTPAARRGTPKPPVKKSPAVSASEKRAAARKAVPAKAVVKAPAVKGAKDLSAYADKPITDSMKAYFRWVEKQTGVKLDERSAYLGYMLRSDYQAANRAAK